MCSQKIQLTWDPPVLWFHGGKTLLFLSSVRDGRMNLLLDIYCHLFSVLAVYDFGSFVTGVPMSLAMVQMEYWSEF